MKFYQYDFRRNLKFMFLMLHQPRLRVLGDESMFICLPFFLLLVVTAMIRFGTSDLLINPLFVKDN